MLHVALAVAERREAQEQAQDIRKRWDIGLHVGSVEYATMTVTLKEKYEILDRVIRELYPEGPYGAFHESDALKRLKSRFDNFDKEVALMAAALAYYSSYITYEYPGGNMEACDIGGVARNALKGAGYAPSENRELAVRKLLHQINDDLPRFGFSSSVLREEIKKLNKAIAEKYPQLEIDPDGGL